jgi:mannosyl-3-phosphoglycerate phosphatase family protein|nr:MAG: mannosyl-3-phosphoglycerate phosphatase [Bacteroidota bacterium]
MDMARLVIFTDLDGTLLSRRTYGAGPAEEALALLRGHAIPVVCVTAKTWAELEPLIDELDLQDPCIVENGGALYLPKGYFPFLLPGSRQEGLWEVLVFNQPYERVWAELEVLRREGFRFCAFHEVSTRQIARWTGLDPASALRAQQRLWDVTIRLEEPPARRALLAGRLRKRGLHLQSGGRFWHVFGPYEKGEAVRRLRRLYEYALGPIRAVGIGDAPNDEPLWAAVDEAYQVASAPGRWRRVRVPTRRIPEVGPRGWVRVVENLLARL